MENYSLLMGDNNGDEDGGGVDGGAFRALPRPGGVPEQRLCSPDLGFAMAAALEVLVGGCTIHNLCISASLHPHLPAMNPTSGQGGLLGVRPTVVIPQQQLQDLAANSHAPLQLLQQAHGGLAVESDVPTKRQRINDLSVGSDVTVLLQLQDNLAVAGESVLSKEESFEGRSVNLPSNEGRQHEASLQVIRRSLLDESRELIDHASKLRDVNAHLVNRAMKLWNEYAVLLNEHSSLSKENSSLSKENLSMVNQNGSLTKENISILKENSSLKKENISILKENSSLKKEHTYYKWRSMTGNK
ncbi:hypothetical protein QYE76_040670 [Lolium multiflorum]|uniref:Uncharacterized protein n=1 Tax=Lolium multiflorum TaxID=4521 RepID=A0AAD8TDE8_LOLMU|nr:hypothetical protein QYE76_040670 [Lolium multiflorum]